MNKISPVSCFNDMAVTPRNAIQQTECNDIKIEVTTIGHL